MIKIQRLEESIKCECEECCITTPKPYLAKYEITIANKRFRLCENCLGQLESQLIEHLWD